MATSEFGGVDDFVIDGGRIVALGHIRLLLPSGSRQVAAMLALYFAIHACFATGVFWQMSKAVVLRSRLC